MNDLQRKHRKLLQQQAERIEDKENLEVWLQEAIEESGIDCSLATDLSEDIAGVEEDIKEGEQTLLELEARLAEMPLQDASMLQVLIFAS